MAVDWMTRSSPAAHTLMGSAALTRLVFGGVVAQRQVRPPSSVFRMPPGPTFAPPAPRPRPSQPRAGLANRGAPRRPPEQFTVKSCGLPRLDQVRPPLSVRKSAYFWHPLELQ